ncbi:toxin-antitoxin system YwqK family antitoxin [Raineya orbicola]|jgi:antitoxin component YwqK of YwqJK toxin-antitoxin module|uniref:MORN repeat variant n=1 Tax=Raineya orbicola TaxID=2016530 RepID=A0A2N3I9H4_9BACT|nr:toxin-antitoxin system YwqK family antitoxin [Raineya orbicola]PKQ66883.1 MORN repeat variant [Raineya orbicola]
MKKYSFNIKILLVSLLGFSFNTIQSFSQSRLMREYYDDEEKKLKQEYQVDLGDSGWEKNGYYKSFYPSSRLAVEGNFKMNIKNGWFREYYDTTFNRKNPIKSQVFYENGKKKGLMCVFNLTGDTLQKATFENDQIVGKVLTYHNNGKLLREGNFVEGLPEGVTKEYYENGKIFKELSFVKGQMHGISKTFYPSGNLQLEETYQNGLKEGLQKEFYDLPSSPIMLEYTMINNTKDGIEKLYSEQGKVIAENTYKSGILHGKVRKWDKETLQLIYEATYEKGYRIGKEIENYPDGKPYQIKNYSNFEQNKSVVVYARTGEMIFEGNYQNNLLNGLVKESKDGFRSEITYRMGKKDGNFSVYYPNSQLQSRGHYVNDLLNGNYEEYYENGRIKIKGTYRMGKKVGKWFLYDENGKETIEKF